MGEKFDISTLVGIVIGILITVAIGMGIYAIANGLVADGKWFDTSLTDILNKILTSITGKRQSREKLGVHNFSTPSNLEDRR